MAESAGGDVWRRMRDGRRVESRRPSDETPERLLSRYRRRDVVSDYNRVLRNSPREKSRRGKYTAPKTDVYNGISISRDKDISMFAWKKYTPVSISINFNLK